MSNSIQLRECADIVLQLHEHNNRLSNSCPFCCAVNYIYRRRCQAASVHMEDSANTVNFFSDVSKCSII